MAITPVQSPLYVALAPEDRVRAPVGNTDADSGADISGVGGGHGHAAVRGKVHPEGGADGRAEHAQLPKHMRMISLAKGRNS